jgi:hypothetical protein
VRPEGLSQREILKDNVGNRTRLWISVAKPKYSAFIWLRKYILKLLFIRFCLFSSYLFLMVLDVLPSQTRFSSALVSVTQVSGSLDKAAKKKMTNYLNMQTVSAVLETNIILAPVLGVFLLS